MKWILLLLPLSGCVFATPEILDFCSRVCEKNNGCKVYEGGGFFSGAEIQCNDGAYFYPVSDRWKLMNSKEK